MWDKIYAFGKELLTLKKQVESNTKEIKDLRQDFDELTDAVKELREAVNSNEMRAEYERTNAQNQREILLLGIENKILKMEGRLRLPPSQDGD